MIGYMGRVWRSLILRFADDLDQEHLPYHLPELKFSSFDSLLFEDYLEEREVQKDDVVETVNYFETTAVFDLDLVIHYKQQCNHYLLTFYKINWSGPNDPLHPFNWPLGRRWTVTLIVSGFTFTSSLASTMVAPALLAISKDLSMNSDVEQMLVLSIFMVAYAIGPLFFGPLSEMFGRVPVLRWSNFLFLIFNTASGSVASRSSIIILRFLSGLCACAPQTVS